MNKITIKTNFKNDYITRKAGEKLRLSIEESLQKKAQLELDFSDLVIASTSFFDEGIAKLALSGWTKKDFDNYITITNLNNRDQVVLEKMCKERKFK